MGTEVSLVADDLLFILYILIQNGFLLSYSERFRQFLDKIYITE
jgi:hypothetical protein